jgi:hypothetical protein
MWPPARTDPAIQQNPQSDNSEKDDVCSSRDAWQMTRKTGTNVSSTLGVKLNERGWSRRGKKLLVRAPFRLEKAPEALPA